MNQRRLLLTAMTFGSSLASFAAYTLLLQFLGSSSRVDIIFYAASLPMAVAGLVSGVLLYSLPPRLTQVGARRQLSTVRLLLDLTIVLTVVGVLIGVAGASIATDGLFPWLLGGFILTGGLTVMSTIAICLSQSRGAYLRSGAGPLVASLGLLAGSLAAIAWRTEWLLLVGQLIGTAISIWIVARGYRIGAETFVRHNWQIGARNLAPLRKHILAICMGTLTFSLFSPIDAALCTQLGSGSVTVMAYSLRVLIACGTAISLGAYVIAARTSSDAMLAGGLPALRKMATREVARIVFLGLLLWLVYILGGDQILVRLFSTSNMPANDVARLRDCLAIMLIAAGPMTAIPYLFRVFYTLSQYRKPALIGVCVPPLYAGIAFALLPSQQILGLAISFAIVWWISFVVTLYWLLNHKQTNNSDRNNAYSHATAAP